jgi:hypothetical protein
LGVRKLLATAQVLRAKGVLRGLITIPPGVEIAFDVSGAGDEIPGQKTICTVRSWEEALGD